MARSNVANHSLRLNLDNEQHRRVEKVLASLNLDVHKSINQFLVDAADSYIRKLEGSDLTYDEAPKKAELRYLTMEDIAEVRREIKDELQREMIGILASSLIAGKVIQMPEIREVPAQNNTEEDTQADETTIGLASSWG
ncbi:MAG: hypothetical protein ACI4TA_04600 [Acetatifactor sp.]